jgi:hypothetical protein
MVRCFSIRLKSGKEKMQSKSCFVYFRAGISFAAMFSVFAHNGAAFAGAGSTDGATACVDYDYAAPPSYTGGAGFATSATDGSGDINPSYDYANDWCRRTSGQYYAQCGTGNTSNFRIAKDNWLAYKYGRIAKCDGNTIGNWTSRQDSYAGGISTYGILPAYPDDVVYKLTTSGNLTSGGQPQWYYKCKAGYVSDPRSVPNYSVFTERAVSSVPTRGCISNVTCINMNPTAATNWKKCTTAISTTGTGGISQPVCACYPSCDAGDRVAVSNATAVLESVSTGANPASSGCWRWKCNSGFVRSGNACVPVQCNSGQYLSGGTCHACPAGPGGETAISVDPRDSITTCCYEGGQASNSIGTYIPKCCYQV